MFAGENFTEVMSVAQLSQREKMSYAFERMGRKDVGFNREQTAGMLGSLAGESGRSLNTRAHNPKDPNGGSIGIGQWHSERRTALENFAKTSKWGGADDFRTQVDFIAHELNTTHKGVKDKMLGATTRTKASDVWTKRYEIPAKAYENLAGRRKNADYFARANAAGPKSPGAAVDAAGASIGGALGEVADVSFTGANLPGGIPGKNLKATATAYAETGPTRANGKAKGPFESLLSGITGGLNSIGSTVNGIDKGIKNAEKKVESAVTGETPEAEAEAKPDDGFFGEASGGAMLGSLVGGYFGGPAGAVVGGLVGQGLNRGLNNRAGLAQTAADTKASGGLLGGVGRVLDGILGGITGGLTSIASPSSESGGMAQRDSGGGGRGEPGGSYAGSGGRQTADGRSYSGSYDSRTGEMGGRGSGMGSVRGQSSHQ